MTDLNNSYPLFETGSPSAQYQQINNFCVNYIEGLLISLMHQEIDESFSEEPEVYQQLQQKLQQRERTVRHAFQFQVEKLFSDFKTIRRTRLHANRSSDWLALGLAGHNASTVQASVERTSEYFRHLHEKQLINITERLKVLTHRTDDALNDNPLAPEKLCNAFLSCIEALSLTSKQVCLLMDIYHLILDQHLDDFYRQLDLGMYYLDILPELTDPSRFQLDIATETEVVTETEEVDEIDEAEQSEEQDTQEPARPEQTVEIKLTTEDEGEPEPEAKYEYIEPTEVIALPVKQQAEDEAKSLADAEAEDHEVEPEIDLVNENIKKGKQQAIFLCMSEFREMTAHGSLDYTTLFHYIQHTLKGLLEEKQNNEINRFFNFYSRLLDNRLLSDPLKIQLSRISQPLLQLVMVDPFFFRSSNHPVNDFLQSIIDFEIRYGKNEPSAALLPELFSRLLHTDNITLDDFLPVIDEFEQLKAEKIDQLTTQTKLHQKIEEDIKLEVLDIMNEITEKLLVEQETLQFFYDDWQLLLLQIARKIGMDSIIFQQAVDIAKLLSWSLDENRKDNPEYQKHTFTSLLKVIDKGLISINFSSQHRNRVRKLLISEFRRLNKITAVFKVSDNKPKQTKVIFNQFSASIHKQTFNLAEIARNKSVIEDASVKDFLDKLQIGSWVEVKTDNTTRYKRGKLKWKAQDNSLFIFIDQRGHKINESSIDQLKFLIAEDSIRLLSSPSMQSNKRPMLGHGFGY